MGVRVRMGLTEDQGVSNVSVCLRGRVGGCEGGGVRGAGGEKREVPRGVMDRLRLAIWA